MKPHDLYSRAGRCFVIAVGTATTAMVGAHSLAAVLRHLGPSDAPVAAEPLTFAGALVGLLIAVSPARGPRVGATGGAVAAALFALVAPASWAAVLSLPLVGLFVGYGAQRLEGKLPEDLVTTVRERRGVALGWALLSLVSVVQVGRLATYMTDPSFDFVLLTRHPFWYGHDCLGAYLYGAELAERGEPNLYHASHYPALDPEAAPTTRLAGMRVEDPYQYPPQFLLLPLAGVRFIGHFPTIRTLWFGLQFFAFVAVYLGLASWIGGRAGRIVLGSLPPLFGALPFLFSFQYGQFHLMAIALALGAMVAFTARRTSLGGFLLAGAILAKVFPAVLLVALALEKRTRALLSTALWGASLSLLAFVVLGPAPFEAFLDYQLPRLGDGAAFAFDEAWPEAAPVVLVDNQGAFGVARKLGLEKPAARVINKVFGLAALALVGLAALRFRRASRWGRASMWTAALGLASLASPGAWGDYVPTAALLLVALLVPLAIERPRYAVPLAFVGVFQYFIVGTMPIGDWFEASILIPLSAIGALSMMALFATVLLLPASARGGLGAVAVVSGATARESEQARAA